MTTQPDPEPGSSPIQFSGTFDDFDLTEELRTGLRDLGYKQPTFVQREVFAPVRGGRDVLVQSRTGSGKTAAFCLPVMRSLDPAVKRPQSLTLCPTRELAVQVATEAARLGHHAHLRVATIYGGASMRAQID